MTFRTCSEGAVWRWPQIKAVMELLEDPIPKSPQHSITAGSTHPLRPRALAVLRALCQAGADLARHLISQGCFLKPLQILRRLKLCSFLKQDVKLCSRERLRLMQERRAGLLPQVKRYALAGGPVAVQVSSPSRGVDDSAALRAQVILCTLRYSRQKAQMLQMQS